MRRVTEPAVLLALLLSLHALGVPQLVSANDVLQGEIRFEPAEKGAAWVGQQVELNLELWSNGFSFGDQLFVLPEVKGGYLMQADSSTVKLSENRGGVQWQGLRYSLLFYPQREGSLGVPSFSVQFTARAGYASEPSRFQYQTPLVYVDARLPPGVEPGSLLVTTGEFRMESSWSAADVTSGPVELKVGDALTLVVTREARDVPGMVFAPLPRLSIDGLAAYPDPPRVNDRVNRGSLTGSRTDSITFICEREGSYTIPAFRFQWWDPGQETLSEEVIPPLELLVSANPALRGGPAGVAGKAYELGWKPLVSVILLLLLLAYPAWRAFPYLRREWRKRRMEREAGEEGAFRQVRKVCAGGSASEAYNAITIWLGRSCTDRAGFSLSRLAASTGDQALAREARLLQEAVIAQTPQAWDGRELVRLLEQHRNESRGTLMTANALAPLNPPPIRRG